MSRFKIIKVPEVRVETVPRFRAMDFTRTDLQEKVLEGGAMSGYSGTELRYSVLCDNDLQPPSFFDSPNQDPKWVTPIDLEGLQETSPSLIQILGTASKSMVQGFTSLLNRLPIPFGGVIALAALTAVDPSGILVLAALLPPGGQGLEPPPSLEGFAENLIAEGHAGLGHYLLDYLASVDPPRDPQDLEELVFDIGDIIAEYPDHIIRSRAFMFLGIELNRMGKQRLIDDLQNLYPANIYLLPEDQDHLILEILKTLPKEQWIPKVREIQDPKIKKDAWKALAPFSKEIRDGKK